MTLKSKLQNIIMKTFKTELQKLPTKMALYLSFGKFFLPKTKKFKWSF